MKSAERLHDLLHSYARFYGDEEEPLAEFCAAWCEGIGVEEAARRLGADLDSRTDGDLRNIANAKGDNLVLVGPFGAWTLIFQIGGWDCASLLGMSALSRDSGRALSLEWGYDGDETLHYAMDGQMITSLSVTYPPLRDGADPHALDPYVEGLRFELGSGPEGPSLAECVTSALTVIARVTGREIDQEWLDGTHALYVMPSRD
ncbi:DUF6461 domain-containing protein [Sphaerisporangium sp. NPDC051011]|uniref:DUF6461 domain-containing protein n=1 Tax=Sphaerisporangium sp. NPDC051011 TaxID=3155792 RepID=UPI003410192D